MLAPSVAVLRRLLWIPSYTRPMSNTACSPIGSSASTLTLFRQRPCACPFMLRCSLPCKLPCVLPCVLPSIRAQSAPVSIALLALLSSGEPLRTRLRGQRQKSWKSQRMPQSWLLLVIQIALGVIDVVHWLVVKLILLVQFVANSPICLYVLVLVWRLGQIIYQLFELALEVRLLYL